MSLATIRQMLGVVLLGRHADCLISDQLSSKHSLILKHSKLQSFSLTAVIVIDTVTAGSEGKLKS